MLKVTRDGRVVRFELLVFDAGGPFHFQLETPSEWVARLLVSAIERQLSNSMETVRRDAYLQGWRDKASKKTAKETWFSGDLP